MSFRKRLTAGEFVVLAEMNTPKGVDISQMVTNARRVKERVHGAVIPDMDNGIMAMSSLAGAALISQQGIEPIVHVYGRDRNRMALQGDMLAAHVMGVRTLIVVPAEEMSHGDHSDAKTVDDLDEMGILAAIRTLQKGVDLAGFELKGSPEFTVGCTLDPYSDKEGLERSLARLRSKVGAGAEFVVTPPVFDLDPFASFLERAKDLGIPVIPTVFLLKTVGTARYMASYEPGVFISEGMIKRIRQSPDRETECIKIAGETLQALREMAQGAKIVTLGWEHRLPAVLEHAGL